MMSGNQNQQQKKHDWESLRFQIHLVIKNSMWWALGQ